MGNDNLVFGDIVIVEKTLIGVIVNVCTKSNADTIYVVYVRKAHDIKSYRGESDICLYKGTDYANRSEVEDMLTWEYIARLKGLYLLYVEQYEDIIKTSEHRENRRKDYSYEKAQALINLADTVDKSYLIDSDGFKIAYGIYSITYFDINSILDAYDRKIKKLKEQNDN